MEHMFYEICVGEGYGHKSVGSQKEFESYYSIGWKFKTQVVRKRTGKKKKKLQRVLIAMRRYAKQK